MQNRIAGVFQVFAAGAIAGLIQTFIIWLTGQIGLFVLLGIPVSFGFNIAWFYQRISWGGLWGLLFLIPLLSAAPQWKRGLVFGLFPALASLFFFLPFKDGQGFLGLALGAMMPIVVVLFNVLWGAIAGFLLDQAARVEQPAD
jgi:hypothetical protein